MTKQDGAKKPSKLKPVLMVLSFLVSLYLIVGGVVLASDWFKIRPYKALASELDKTLGGGYKIGYTWRCGLETSNCPSARMLKDANFKDNDEAKARLSAYRDSMSKAEYQEMGFGICSPQPGGLNVYCTIEGTKDGKKITINAKQDFIGIDIQP